MAQPANGTILPADLTVLLERQRLSSPPQACCSSVTVSPSTRTAMFNVCIVQGRLLQISVIRKPSRRGPPYCESVVSQTADEWGSCSVPTYLTDQSPHAHVGVSISVATGDASEEADQVAEVMQ